MSCKGYFVWPGGVVGSSGRPTARPDAALVFGSLSVLGGVPGLGLALPLLVVPCEFHPFTGAGAGVAVGGETGGGVVAGGGVLAGREGPLGVVEAGRTEPGVAADPGAPVSAAATARERGSGRDPAPVTSIGVFDIDRLAASKAPFPSDTESRAVEGARAAG